MKIRANPKRETHPKIEHIDFNKLRQARQQTQVVIAEKLDSTQAAVSRMEKQSDFLLSTLQEYVRALGGRLDLHVVFPDADFVIETARSKTSRKKRKARAKSATKARGRGDEKAGV